MVACCVGEETLAIACCVEEIACCVGLVVTSCTVEGLACCDKAEGGDTLVETCCGGELTLVIVCWP